MSDAIFTYRCRPHTHSPHHSSRMHAHNMQETGKRQAVFEVSDATCTFARASSYTASVFLAGTPPVAQRSNQHRTTAMT